MRSVSLLKLEEARDVVVPRVRCLSANRRRPFLVAIDGRSGAGKTVLGTTVAEALEPLLHGETAEWHAFDFALIHPDGTYPPQREPTRRSPAAVIVLEGAISSGPQIADLVDLSVLVDAPVSVFHEWLSAREDKEFLRTWYALLDNFRTPREDS